MPEQDAADHRQDDGEKGRDQGGPQSWQQVGRPGHRIDERAPLRGSELALGGKCPDQEIQQCEDGKGADHRNDGVATASLGPRSVEQHTRFGTHRFTASRRDKAVKPMPTGSVKITKPVAMITKMT